MVSDLLPRPLRFCVVMTTVWALLILQLLVMPPELWAVGEECKMACGNDERTCCCRLVAKATGRRALRHHHAGPAFETPWRVCPIPEMALAGASGPAARLATNTVAQRLTGHGPAVRRGDRLVLTESPTPDLLPRPPPAFSAFS